MSAEDLCGVAECRVVDFMVHDRGRVRWHPCRPRNSLRVVDGLPPIARSAVGVVDAARLWLSGVLGLPELSRLRLPGHLAWPRHVADASAIRGGHGAQPATHHGLVDVALSTPTGALGRRTESDRSRTGGPAFRRARDCRRRPRNPSGWRGRRVRGGRPRLHRSHCNATALDQRSTRAIARPRPGRFRQRCPDDGPDDLPVSLVRGPVACHLHHAVALAGISSLATAIGVHFTVGYTDALHLLPALLAASCLLVGLALQHPGVASGQADDAGRSPRAVSS